MEARRVLWCCVLQAGDGEEASTGKLTWLSDAGMDLSTEVRPLERLQRPGAWHGQLRRLPVSLAACNVACAWIA